MNILMIGDIFGSPGRNAVATVLPTLIHERKLDFVVANVENAAGGRGITRKIGEQLFKLGIDVMTSGNHIWDQKDVVGYISEEPRLLRPANYAKEQPGAGSIVVQSKADVPVGIINVEGQLFLGRVDCPFHSADHEMTRIEGKAKVILLDIHAEATSEKRGMGWHMDGRASAVVGTHTHVPTADAEILPKGTAYITDLGMTGPYNSVIGLDKDVAHKRLFRHLPEKMKVAEGDVRFCAVYIEVDEKSGRAENIESIQIKVDS
jgi:2',3'-cyclic-nucleotide 2'-phosphodiesterase